jgi:hypothetical protein
MSTILIFPLAYAKRGDTDLYNLAVIDQYCIKNVYNIVMVSEDEP